MSERQKLVHLHTSGTTEPSAAMLNLGEIAVQHASEESCLYIKNQDEELIKFIPSGTIQTMIDNISIDCGEYQGPKYLTFEAVSANSTVQLNIYNGVGAGSFNGKGKFLYSTDNGETWNEYIFTQQGRQGFSGQTITLSNIGDTVNFRGRNGSLCYTEGDINYTAVNYHKFKLTGRIKANGDITSLNNGIGGDIPMSAVCYTNLFNNNVSLLTPPNLPSTVLAPNCYGNMFNGCTSLTTAPELPATNLAYICYRGMFNGCTSLTTAPELPATNLAQGCYNSMFYNCEKLSYIKALFLTSPSNTYTGNWVSGVASAGTFVKNSEATWTVTGVNAVPNGWTIETASS